MLSADNFYWYASVLIFVPWILLIVAPSWRYTEPVAFGAAYFVALIKVFDLSKVSVKGFIAQALHIVVSGLFAFIFILLAAAKNFIGK